MPEALSLEGLEQARKNLGVTRLLVKKILEQPHGHEWSIQGLGMLRLYLSKAVRLHVWHPRPPYKVKNVSELHNHPWDFSSLIICGWVKNHVYWPNKAGEPWMRGKIECGPNPKKVGARDVYETRLSTNSQTYYPGDTYEMSADTIHRSEPCPGSVTICERRPKADPDHAEVCWAVGTEWVSAEPRPATRDEVEAVTKAALSRMHSEDEGLTY